MIDRFDSLATQNFIDNKVVKKVTVKDEILKNDKLKNKMIDMLSIEKNIKNTEFMLNLFFNKNNDKFTFNKETIIIKDRSIFLNKLPFIRIIDEIKEKIIDEVIFNDSTLNEIMLFTDLINEILYINKFSKYSIKDDFIIHSLIQKKIVNDDDISKKFSDYNKNIENIIINIFIKNLIISVKKSNKNLLKFSDIIFITLKKKIFLKKIKNIIRYIFKNKHLKICYYKWLYLVFFLKNNIVNIAIYNQKIELVSKYLKFFFLKNNIYLFYFYNYHFHITEFSPCFIKTIFYLRNITLIFKNKFLFRFFTLGLIVLNKKSKSNINFYINFIKLFFFNFFEYLNNNINIIFYNLSKKINLIFFYLNFYVNNSNKDIYKYYFLKLKSILFKNKFNFFITKGPKKPRKKKFITKKNRKYFF